MGWKGLRAKPTLTNQIKDGFLDYHEIFRREQSVLTGGMRYQSLRSSSTIL